MIQVYKENIKVLVLETIDHINNNDNNIRIYFSNFNHMFYWALVLNTESENDRVVHINYNIPLIKEISKQYSYFKNNLTCGTSRDYHIDELDTMIEQIHKQIKYFINITLCHCQEHLVLNDLPYCSYCFFTNKKIDRDCPICLESTMIDDPIHTHTFPCCGCKIHTDCKNQLHNDNCIICRNNDNDSNSSQSLTIRFSQRPSFFRSSANRASP